MSDGLKGPIFILPAKTAASTQKSLIIETFHYVTR